MRGEKGDVEICKGQDDINSRRGVTDGPDCGGGQVHEVHEVSAICGPYMAKWSSYTH